MIVSAALVTVFAAGGATWHQMALLSASVAALVAVVTAGRIHRHAYRLPWNLVAFGLSLLTVVNALSWVGDTLHGGVSVWPIAPFQIAGYLALLAASLLVVRRRARDDSGEVIDAAVLGIAAAAPVWEYVLRPALLAAKTPTYVHIGVLVQILPLMGILGSMLRIAQAAGRQQVSVWLFFGALACAVAGDVSFTTTGNTPGIASAVTGLCYMAGYLLMGAAALHPTAGTLTTRAASNDAAPTKTRFSLFGGALIAIPVVGGIPQLFGQAPDGLLLTLGPLAMVPMVLIRARQLLAQRSQDRDELEYQASHDDLTGLVNRRKLFADVKHALMRATHSPPSMATVLYCDLDDFKPINDRYGHEAGDEVLRCVARRLAATLRESDIVARVGGDEFLAYCPGVDRTAAGSLRHSVEDALKEPILWNGTTLSIGVTVGTATSVQDGNLSPDELIAAADAAMYERKRARKSTPLRATTRADVGHVADGAGRRHRATSEL
ncbi:GGDEF domain-containing protein [Actinoplanes sp. NBC_00393]|uniref:sensor domain-containing diguanylate cyclase n=1 Tax=Actinoplanes sp. NBC_00393 TaxID=2975953 RepID=UPI002E1EAA3A